MNEKILPKKAALLFIIGVLMLLANAQGTLALSTGHFDAWLTFDTANYSAPTYYDVIGGNDGTLQAGTAGVAGKMSEAVSFSGGNGDGVTVFDNASLHFDTDDSFSFGAWVYPDDSTEGYIIGNERSFSGCGGSSSNKIYLSMNLGGRNNELLFSLKDGINSNSVKYDRLAFGKWHHIVATYEGVADDLRLYVNGSQANTTVDENLNGNLAVEEWIIGAQCDTNNVFKGDIDEAFITDELLNDTAISDLYSSGSGTKPPFTTPESGIPTTYTLNVKDRYDDAGISGINVSFYSGIGGSIGWNTTDASGNAVLKLAPGSVEPYVLANSTNLTAYLNTTTWRIGQNSTNNSRVYQGAYNVTSITRLIDDTILGPALGTWTVNTTGGKTYNECGATYPCNIYLQNGTNKLTLQYTGAGDYYDKNFIVNISAPEATTGTVSGVYDALLSVTSKDYWTNASINTFEVNASNTTETYSVNVNTTNGTANIPGVQGIDYFLIIDAPGYAFANETINLTNSTPSYEFSLHTTNSVKIYFFDEFTDGSITQNVTVAFSGPNSTFESSSTTGYLYEDLLEPGTWTLTMNSAGYDERNYYITVSERSHQTLNAYLLNSTLSADTIFNIKDSDGNNIPNSTITMQDKINGSWVTIAQKMTDFFGIAYFPLLYAHTYKAIIESPGYITKAAEFERVKTEYTIRLSSENTQDYTTYAEEFTYSMSPQEAKPEPTNFTISTSSPSGSLEWFATRVLLNGSYTLTNNSGSPSGGTATVSLNLTTYQGYYATVWYMAKSTGIDEPLIIEREFYIFGQIPGNYTLSSFASHYDAELSSEEDEGKAFKAVIVTIAAVGAALALGLAINISAGSLTAAGVFILGGAVGWMSWSYVIITAGGLILTAFLGRNR